MYLVYFGLVIYNLSRQLDLNMANVTTSNLFIFKF